MRKYIYLLCSLPVFLLLLVACEQEYTGFRPYDWKYYGVNKAHKIYETTYDKSSRLKSITTYEFSQSGDILSIYDVNRDRTDSTGTLFKYNEKNELVSVTTPQYIYEPHLNGAGNLVREDFITSKSSDDKKTGYYKKYKYNSLGQITEKESCEYDKESYNTLYTYWNNGNMKSYEVTAPGGEKTTYACDTLGNVTEKKVFSRKGKLRETYTTEYTYDSLYNWTAKTTYRNNRFYERADRMVVYFAKGTKGVDVKKMQYTKTVNQMSYMDGVMYRLTHFGFTDNTPSATLLYVVLGLGVLLFIIALSGWGEDLFRNFLGEPNPDTHMRRTWVFNSNPYGHTLKLFGILLLSFIASFLILLILALLLWVLFWIIKIFFIIVVWIGYIAVVAGFFALFTSEKGVGCGTLVVGGIIVYFKDTLDRWGEGLVGWAGDLLSNLNLISWTSGLVSNYWDIILMIVFSPLALALSIALIVIVITFILRLLEFGVMRIYNIRRSCPSCGAREFDYLVEGEKHPVALCPGTYGIFHQISPVNGEKLPTMLFNGKARLTRECKSCGQIINMQGEEIMGTEVHIGIVGSRSSGKSYLLNSALDLLREAYDEDFQQVDTTMYNRLEDNIARIKNHDDIQTQDRDLYKAVQVSIKTNRHRAYPYHLFFYDVAGEKFNPQSLRSRSGMDFYKHVSSIVFVLDPAQVDVTMVQSSRSFIKWSMRQHADSEKYDVDDTLTMCISILNQAGRKPKDINFYFVCSKGDLGYLAATGYPSMDACDSDAVRNFLVNDVGLINAINNVENNFKTCSYTVVSTEDGKTVKLRELTRNVLKDRGVNVSL